MAANENEGFAVFKLHDYDDLCFSFFPSCMKYTRMAGSYKILDQILSKWRGNGNLRSPPQPHDAWH
ncbi:hypothetical protein TSUD_312080 [Trifolium subterraneum]|uniref:Uncharacterized protein n=1 Tax=Trifolium subterraneum TaxID=3900 RepID=A0A2Z6M4A2_TRISU|nr:hypothetical protein TSUD_312080 [Trifolium subterraneum]